ncbi:hypothetical protein BDV27DRAFT_159732 [Aspergillus caelatus]|uniref:NAD-dependent epimerase/dehydratase domain-containing protein n=1 Tax=Aspergillus caelatus TaxID=61420 RepID=A0A5N6ZXW8_9EURO|nr:uncharacterized protein BDV27DRAFT_159732 [Aspergillus caelatus]KAE8362451.1 hypothetical protein BDV27DRAFT_159732 [Aspergillus caelatus]
MGGAGFLTYFDSEVKKTFGEADDKVFNDLEGINELINLPAAAFHRNMNNVHVRDLSRMFELLVQAAMDPSSKDDPEIWERMVIISREMQGFIKGGGGPELRDWSIDEAVNSSAGFEAASWGMNSRGVAARAKKVLGWQPQERSLSNELPDIIRCEAARMGL